MLDELKSSTPDGMAPLANVGLIVFVCVFCGLAMLWGLANLVILIKMRSEGESTEKSERIFELSRKMLRGSFDIVKLTCGVGLVAAIIFFLTIMGAVEHFSTFYYSISYLLGAINSILVCGVSAIISNMTLARVINFARFSINDAFDTARRSAIFQTFFFMGWPVFGLGLFMVLYHQNNQQWLKEPEQMSRVAKILVSFSFGAATVAIGCRICNSIYAKGSQMAIATSMETRLPKNHKHPNLIIKALGQNFNSCISTILDSITYITSAISLTIYAAAHNVIGADQEGEIIFQLSLNNCYLPFVSFFFSLFFVFFFNLLSGMVLRPTNSDQVRIHFNAQKYMVFGFLCGFQSLAAYLGLPAQFFIKELPGELKHPYLAYICLLFGMFICLLMGIGSELATTHPKFVGMIANSCSTGSATNIIYGLSFGYMFNFLPFIFIVGTLFLCNWWLGAFGAGLACIGFLSLLPVLVYGSLTYSYLDNSSFLAYISGQEDGLIQTLITASQLRKDHEPHMLSYHYGMMAYFGFLLCQMFVDSSFTEEEYSSSLKSPTIFLGLLLGAMYPYFTSACLIRSIHKCSPAIGYDLSRQIEEVPSMGQSSIDADVVRTNALFGFQCVLSLKRFFLLLFYPMLVLGIGIGPQSVLGFLAGSVISAVQLGLSSLISGSIWNTVKKDIGSGMVRDGNDQLVKGQSEWGRASEVGNQVGQPLRHCVAPTIHMMIVYVGLQSIVLGEAYASIHGQ